MRDDNQLWQPELAVKLGVEIRAEQAEQGNVS
jgi:hypothetical protein